MRLPKQIGDKAVKEKIRSLYMVGVYLSAHGIQNINWGDYLFFTERDAEAGKDFWVFLRTDQRSEVCIGRYVRQKPPKRSWVFKPVKHWHFAVRVPVRRFK